MATMLFGVMLPSFVGIAIIMLMITRHIRGRISAVIRYRIRPGMDQTARQTVAQLLLYSIAASLLPNNALYLVNHSFNSFFPIHDTNVRFVLSFMMKLKVPLQGLFILIIFIRPRCIMLRRKKGDSPSFCSLMSEFVVGVKSRPLEADQDQLADHFAPELAVPGSNNFDSESERVDEDHLP